MSKMIFVNLPVSDLARATAFYEAVGAVKNPQFCDGTASCMVFSDTIYAMLLTHDKFRQFTPKAIADSRTTSEVLIALSADSRAGVDEMVDKAWGAGGRVDPCPQQEHGFMYGRSFEDPDGHIWEVLWMDPAAIGESRESRAEKVGESRAEKAGESRAEKMGESRAEKVGAERTPKTAQAVA